jgi:hypothetical protein
MRRQFIVAIVVVLLILDVSFRVLKSYAPEFQTAVLQGANIIMAALSLAAYFLVNRQIGNRPHAFVRGVYSASLLKLMVCMFAVLAYVLVNRAHIHKPTVFMLFGVYAVYSIVETILLSRTAKTTK